MALGLDQGLQWEYIPPTSRSIIVSQDVDDLICAEELMTLVTRIQESDNATLLNHPITASSLSHSTLLHTILCATACHRCKNMPPCKDSQCSQCSQPSLVTSEPSKAASKADPSHPELKEMQSPRLPLLVFMLAMLLEIQARASQQANLLSSTLFHFFTTLDRAMCDGNSTNIRTAWKTSSWHSSEALISALRPVLRVLNCACCTAIRIATSFLLGRLSSLL
jgi:hypothetical protein